MKVTRENMVTHFIEYQLNMVGKTVDDVKDDKFWYSNNCITREQFLEFKKYAVALLKKTFRCNKSKAESTFEWYNCNWGLRVIPTKEEHEQIKQLVEAELKGRINEPPEEQPEDVH